MIHSLPLSLRNRIVWCALLLLVAASPTSAQAVLNGNGGFESFDLGEPSNTADWFFQVSDPSLADLLIVDDPVFAGDRALSVAVNATGDNLQFSNQGIDVTGTGSGTYRYTAWARASADGAQLQAIGDHQGGSFSWFGNETFTLTTEWQELTFEFEVPEESGGESVDVIRATHVLNSEVNVGATVYLDEVQVTKVEPPATQLVSQWGFNGDGQGWSLTTGGEGEVTVSGGAPPAGWVPLRGEFESLSPAIGEALVVTGELELVGGGLPAMASTNYPALRYGVYQDSTSAGMLVDSTWSGTAGNHYGYLFTAPSGTGGAVAWQGSGEDGTFGGIRDRTWFSTNGPNDYVLGDQLQLPANAQATAGIYDFAFSFAPQEGGGMEVTFYLIKEDDSYFWASSAVDDSLQVTSFNSVNFAISADVTATGMTLRDVTAELGEPITIPLAPGELRVTNGSFEDTEPGVITDLAGGIEGWVLEVGSSVGTAPEFAVDDDVAQEGDNALRVTVNEVGSNSYDIQATADAIPVEPGETYVYSAWARAAEAGATANFTVGNYDFAEYGRLGSQALSTEWEEFTFEFTVTDEETVIRAPLHFSFAGNVGNAVYIDNVSIVDVNDIGEAATVTFEDQTSTGLSLVVASVTVPEDGYVAIHDASLLEGDALGSVIGVSEFLEAGTYTDLTVALFDVPGLDVPADTSLTEDQTLIAMPHRESGGNMTYDFLSSEGAEDGPFFVDNDPNQGAVTDDALITIALEGDLVTNGSFEDTEPGVITDLTGGIEGWVLEVGSSVETAPEFAVVDDVAQEGDQSLRVTVNGTGDNPWDIQAIADAIPVEPGETYVYSAWARAAEAGAMASFTVGNYDFAEYGRLGSQALSTEWEEFTFEFTVTDEETVIRAPLHFSFAGNVGNAVYIDNVSVMAVPPVANEPGGVPQEFALRQNYPNPFARSTTIGYDLVASAHVTLTVYNVLGQRVALLVDQPQEAGRHEAELDASGLASGAYFYRIEAGEHTESRRMMLVK